MRQITNKKANYSSDFWSACFILDPKVRKLWHKILHHKVYLVIMCVCLWVEGIAALVENLDTILSIMQLA